MTTSTILKIEWEAVELLETISMHDKTYRAKGIDDFGNEYEAIADVCLCEIEKIYDVKPVKK